MKRRDFMKYFFIFTSALIATGVFRGYAVDHGEKRDSSDVKIKKYPGKIKLLGDEVSREGKWNG
ncbi:MAG: hypothetical protein WC637_05510 [Victivallales bacterium]